MWKGCETRTGLFMLNHSGKTPTIQDVIQGGLTDDEIRLFLIERVKTDLMNKAGYIPQKTPKNIELERNPIHWRSSAYHINAGQLWIFYAVEYNHFSPTMAKKIWRYGQTLNMRDHIANLLSRRSDLEFMRDLLHRWHYITTNINDFHYIKWDYKLECRRLNMDFHTGRWHLDEPYYENDYPEIYTEISDHLHTIWCDYLNWNATGQRIDQIDIDIEKRSILRILENVRW